VHCLESAGRRYSLTPSATRAARLKQRARTCSQSSQGGYREAAPDPSREEIARARTCAPLGAAVAVAEISLPAGRVFGRRTHGHACTTPEGARGRRERGPPSRERRHSVAAKPPSGAAALGAPLRVPKGAGAEKRPWEALDGLYAAPSAFSVPPNAIGRRRFHARSPWAARTISQIAQASKSSKKTG